MFILVANKGKRIVHQTTKIQSETEYSMLLMQTLLSPFYRIHNYINVTCSTKFGNCIVPFKKNDLNFVVHHKCFVVFLYSSLFVFYTYKDVKSV